MTSKREKNRAKAIERKAASQGRELTGREAAELNRYRGRANKFEVIESNDSLYWSEGDNGY